HMLARSTGEMMIGVSVLAIPALIIGFLFLGLQFPPDLPTALLSIVSVLLGFLLFFHLNFILGSLAIVALDIRHISWAYFSIVRFLGGQVVPLWLFPPVVAAIAEVLPFKGTYYIPISIYVGRLTGVDAIRGLEFQIVWLIALAVVSRMLWGWAHRRLVVQGG
ncbi:MAG TPA: ABC-2 family transporter protein, partial [Anaerolineales bacterium]|nr:ABC-2 family transporter protein [Anaerolineales bacterium]